MAILGAHAMLALMFLVSVIPIILLIHVIATVYFQKKGYYRSKSFTIKHIFIAMPAPIIGMVLITFEYVMNLSKNGIHVGTFLSLLFVYGFIALIFALPYLLHLFSVEDQRVLNNKQNKKDDSTPS